jgi:hypothetical protein
MDQRSNLGGADPLDTVDDTPVLESETVYQGMTVAPVYDGDTYADEFDDGGTVAYDEENNPEIEAQKQRIERTRAQMGNTIDAIEERLSPSRLAQEAKTAVKDATVGQAQQAVSNISDSASDFGGSVVETIRENPIPAALAGIGIGWLIMSMRNSGSNGRTQRDAQRYRYYGHNMYPTQRPYYAGGTDQSGQSGMGGIVNSAQDAAGSVADTAQNAASQAAGTIQDTASQVGDTIGSAAGSAADSLGQMSDQAQYGFQRAESELQRWMREQPLAVTAGAFAVGMAVGLAIPETQIEDQWMGEYRQDLTQQAQQVVQETAPKVEKVAEKTVSAAKDAAQNAASQQGLPTPSGSSSAGSSTSGKSSSSKSSKPSSGSSGSGSSS